MICRSSMTPAEKKAAEAVVRAAKPRRCTHGASYHVYTLGADKCSCCGAPRYRQEAKREKRRGK